VGAKRTREELDRYDVAILSALATNTRLTTVEIATIVHLSRTAVSRRIATLKRMGVLNDSADILNYEMIGFGVRAVVELSAPSQIITSLKPALLRRPEVLAISVIAGDGSLSLDVIAVDMDHLHGFVRSPMTWVDAVGRAVFSDNIDIANARIEFKIFVHPLTQNCRGKGPK